MTDAPHERGDFGGAALAGGRIVDPADFLDDREILGLCREGTYVWGTVRDARGQPLSLMRRIPPAGAATGLAGQQSLGSRLIVMDSQDADGLAIRREAKTAASSDDIERALVAGSAVFSAPAGERAGMRLETDGPTLQWTEEGLVSLTGQRVCSGLQWYLPGGWRRAVLPDTDLARRGRRARAAGARLHLPRGGVPAARGSAVRREGSVARRPVPHLVLVGDPVG